MNQLGTVSFWKYFAQSDRKSKPVQLGRIFLALLVIWGCGQNASAQTAKLSDAYWSYEQDCDGDTNRTGTLAGNFARLNWFPDVNNCNGSLNVFEIISYRPCGTTPWIPLYTNANHIIAGCSVPNQRYLDIQMGSSGECRDYKIDLYRVGQPNPDSIRSSTNDVHLAQHKEEQLVEDTCANDSFASCVVLSGGIGNRSDTTTTATKESNEPDHAGNPGGHSLWYCWTAPTNLPVTFDTTGSGFDTILGIYTGSDLTSLTVVTNKDDISGATNRMSRVTFTPVTGTTYRVAVDGFGGARGVMELNWNQAGTALPDLIVWGPAASPYITTESLAANDCQVLEGCATAGTRKLLRFNMETRNIGFADLALGNPSTNSLYRFATCHGHYHFEAFAQYTLFDTNFNPVLLGTNVVAGRKVGFCVLDFFPWRPGAPSTKKYDCGASSNALTNSPQGIQAGWADVYTADLDCQFIDITGVAAGEYKLQIAVNPDNVLLEDRYDNNSTIVDIVIPPDTCVTNPPNDHFTNATVILQSPFTDSEFNNCATEQPSEPNHAGSTGTRSIWYNWTPTSNHVATINTRRSSFNTVLAVYTGTAVNALTLVTNNNNISADVSQSQVTFTAVSGTTYRIAVDGSGTSVGNAVLNINPPGNDIFTNRYTITGPVGSTNNYNLAGSKEANETAHAYEVGGKSIWYRWVAPTNGFVDFNTKGSSFDTLLAVYTNSTLTSSNLAIAANDDDAQGGGLQTSRLWFYARAGTNYFIAVDGFGGDVGDVKLNWNMNCQLAITNLPGGDVQVSLTGVDWQRYILLGSTNFTDWYTNTAAITMADGVHYYTNTLGTTNNPFSHQFFKAILVP
ncbi:MAG: lysyl oxidase family protein [Verrucomicrobiota bacterium]